MNDICLNMVFMYHRVRFSRVSLDVTLNMRGDRKIGARNIGAPIPVVCHSGSRPRREPCGRFPIDRLSDACSKPVASL